MKAVSELPVQLIYLNIIPMSVIGWQQNAKAVWIHTCMSTVINYPTFMGVMYATPELKPVITIWVSAIDHSTPSPFPSSIAASEWQRKIAHFKYNCSFYVPYPNRTLAPSGLVTGNIFCITGNLIEIVVLCWKRMNTTPDKIKQVIYQCNIVFV